MNGVIATTGDRSKKPRITRKNLRDTVLGLRGTNMNDFHENLDNLG